MHGHNTPVQGSYRAVPVAAHARCVLVSRVGKHPFLPTLRALQAIHGCCSDADFPCMQQPERQSRRAACPAQELTLSESLHYIVPGLACLSALSDLRSLTLAKVGVTNAVLRSVSGLNRLRSLHAPDAFRVTDPGVAHLAGLTGAHVSTLWEGLI